MVVAVVAAVLLVVEVSKHGEVEGEGTAPLPGKALAVVVHVEVVVGNVFVGVHSRLRPPREAYERS